jgi:predicted CoA-binding protein
MLRQHGYAVIPVHPVLEEIAGIPVIDRLEQAPRDAFSLTLYVNPTRALAAADTILALRPRRVVFNPGTESPQLQARLTKAGIPWLEDCTLELLRQGRFDAAGFSTEAAGASPGETGAVV